MRTTPARPAILRTTALLALLASAPALAAAGQDVRVEPGTVLEISAVGVPEFRYKVSVDSAGEASFPLLDPMPVGGKTLAEVRRLVKERLPGKVFRQRMSDGRENFINIGADEITLDVAEYRPIYANGDVSKPGEIPFRPGLTVRQAIALAGGYDLLHSRVSNPFMESADIRGEYEGAWAEHAKQQAYVAGLQALLDGKPAAGIRAGLKAPLAAATLDRIARLETDRVKAYEDDYQKELVHLQAVIREADVQVATLQDEQKALKEATAQQSTDLQRVRGLYEKNVVPVNRVTDEQRQFNLIQERVLAVTAQISEAMRAKEVASRKLQAAPDQRRIKLLSDMQDATVKMQVLQGRIASLDEKLVYTGAAKAQLTRGEGSKPRLVIHRRGEGGMEALDVGEDEPLRAGDVVEVILKPVVPGPYRPAADASAR